MSDYKNSIKDLYNLKLTLTQLKEKQAMLIKLLSGRENPRLKQQLQSIAGLITQTQEGIRSSITRLYADPLTDPLLQIEEQHPLLLLPLRMETRFANSGTELWVRVYPDEISVHTHESALTASEIKAGKYYWRYLWENRNTDVAFHRKKAWSQVANHFGVNRATWIFLKTRPVKLLNDKDFSTILTETDLDPGPVDSKKQAWSEAAKSYVMPDLLKLRLFIGNNPVLETLGNPIAQPLTVSPDPKNTLSTGKLDWKGTDLAWLEDFDKAVEEGMAFKITLPAYDPLVGFSRITVTGIRTLFDDSPLVVPPQAAGSAALTTLFENHLYTPRSLALIPQGTPTNNTDEKRSGYSEKDGFSEEKYLKDDQKFSQTTDPDAMEDGKILALALGLDPGLFQKLENGLDTGHQEAVAMNKALYPATLDFFLRQLLHPLFTTGELDTIRSFFCSYITGRGPIPAIRAGWQPYGILPTSNFKAFKWNAGHKDYKLFQQLTALLLKLDAVYEAGIPGISKLGQLKDPHVLLDEILGLYPNSETFYQRVGYSENVLRNCLAQTVTNNPNPLLEQLIQSFSTYTGPAPEGILPLKKIILERTTLQLNRNNLVDTVIASETKEIFPPAKLSPAIHHGENYLQWLAHQYIRDIQSPYSGIDKDYYAGTDPRIDPPLLYLLLKHGLLSQLYKCVFHWLSAQGFLPPGLSLFNKGTPPSDFIASKDYLNLFLNQKDITPMELMLIEWPNLPFLVPPAPGMPVETAAFYFLQNENVILNSMPPGSITPELLNDFKYLEEFFAALEFLSKLPGARLERTMVEHMDSLTYRLDTWQTALFYKKLELNRSTGTTSGTVIGAYGWLENLKPSPNTRPMNESDLPADLRPGTGMPIIGADQQGGYIHAPSLTQAKAAALLRNAYLHHHDPADPQMMAVNLNSNRVRKALKIFEGIQKGHSAGELLGYRMERHLHDQAIPLDKYIPVLRKEFPLGGKTINNPGNKHDEPAGTSVNKPGAWVARLDGLAIINAIKGGNVYPFGLQVPLPGTGALPGDVFLPETGVEADAIKEGIDDLLDCIDAMKDLIVAESIHQMVQGNTDRAGALLKSIHELKPPAKFESMQTPRTPEEILTHRASVLFNPKPANPWPGVTMSQRASVEPGLNEWLGEIIGPPDTFQCIVTETNSGTNTPITIEELNLQPIDLVYLVPAQPGMEDSEFARRIAYRFRTIQNISKETELVIAYDKAEKNNLSITEVMPLLRLLKEIVTNSKALDAADFDLQQNQAKANFRNLTLVKPGGIVTDVGALIRRKDILITAVESLRKKLWNISKTETATMCADMRKCLVECCDFEIHQGFPESSVGEDRRSREELTTQSADVINQMEKMLISLKRYNSLDEEALRQSFTVFFGPAFKVLPCFHFAKSEDDEIERVALAKDAYDAEKSIFSFITGKTKIAADKLLQNWLNEVSYLRPKLASFEMTRLLYNSFREKQLEVHIMQLPHQANDSWLGLEFPADMQSGKGKLSMLIHHFPQTYGPDWGAPDFSGLLLDEWVEEIPGKEELTGISFQYNQPDSQPPQALLLAISPTEGNNWNWDNLSGIIDDTFRRAKQRSIGTEELSKTDWIGILPGVIAEFSDTKANVSMIFRN